ncbi:MAG TPA: MMPL family transporter [Streptosporangiaceae bacterium]|nr:MMPL family transporter [Streptosporangiaceae bacterium]
MPVSEQPGVAAGLLARGYAYVVVSLRYFIVLGWAAAVVLAIMFLPPLSASSAGGLSQLVPPGSAAARAEADAARLFGFPIDAAVAVVQRDPHGLPAATRDRALRQALSADRQLPGQPDRSAQLARAAAALAAAGQAEAARILSGPPSPGPPGGIPGLAGVFPLPNAAGLLKGTNERSTTVITFLYFRPGTSFGTQTASARQYARWYLGRPGDHVVGVTGPVPAEYEQSQVIGRDILWVELFTVLAIALIVGLRFRSVGAPLAALVCAATAYVLAVRVVVWLAGRMGVTLPPDLDPVLVVLLLGVTTDYAVFFLDGMRARVAGGTPRVRAARLATAEFAPIIFAAGVIVAASAASLAVARTKLLSAFGPGLALTVLTAMAVSMTLGPALMAIFGGLLFRPVPRWMRRQGVSRREGGGRADAAPRAGASVRTRLARFAAARPVALLIAAAGTAGLVVAAWNAHAIQLGSPLIGELPASSAAAQAGTAAAEGFAPGILSPTEVLVIGPGVARKTAALARLQRELARQPGVAELAGPASLPGSAALPASAAQANPMLAASGGAARFVIVEKTDPLDATAINRIRQLQRELPVLGRAAGLAGVRFELAGQTALTGESIGSVFADLGRVALAIMVVTLVLLALFLRSLLAPVYLLAASVLAVFATLGLVILIGQDLLGYSSLVYFVPFAAGVLLVSLGSDYNVFVIGRIWEEARRRPVRDAVAVAAPQASRAITTAGVALAASFGMLAVIPLEQFRQIAIAMALGVVLDAIAVRSLLVPALVALFGRLGMWPGNRRRKPPLTPWPTEPAPAADPSSTIR